MCDMAMFPNATHGYMPFVQCKNNQNGKNKRSKIHVNGGKLQRGENRKHQSMNNLASQKMYQITLKDKNGRIYKCVVKGDSTKTLPELCEKKLNNVATVAAHRSLPDISALNNPDKQRMALSEKLDALNMMSKSEENFSTSLDLRSCGKKESRFRTFIRFLKEITGKQEKDDAKDKSVIKVHTTCSKQQKANGKSKRKNREQAQRKRQRTVSAMSNLDPIAEDINEQDYEDDDNESYSSYSHFSSECSSDNDSVASQSIEQS